MNNKLFLLLLSMVMLTVRFIDAVNYPFTTIASAGFYKLASNVVNQITISVPNVTLDLNGHTVSGGVNGIVVNGGLTNITIKNGTVSGSADGIQINGGCRDIILKEITAKNCLRGMNFEQVTDAIIRNCDFTLNTTGLELDASHNIYVENCVAQANTQAGFSLLSSTTCTLVACKALSTGDGNVNTFGQTSNVFGFVASNGRGNIFEQCIANSTQALTTTDGESVIAGFALRGTEGCSKIINCESSNNTTSPNGVAIPYGILLESRFDALISVTATDPGITNTADQVLSLNWSPDGKYVAIVGAIVGTSTNDLIVYEFDRQTLSLNQIAATNPDGTQPTVLAAVAWSPNGQYLAVGGVLTGAFNDLFLFRFDSSTGTLTQVASANPDSGSQNDSIEAIAWTSDGKYFAVGGEIAGTTNKDLFVYQFDSVLETITEVASVNPGAGTTDDIVSGVDWSPDNQYLAAVTSSGVSGDDLFIFSFNRSSNGLVQITSANPGGNTTVLSEVKWSPDGKYLAVARLQGSSSTHLFLFRFNRTTETLTELQAINVNSGSVRTVSWSSDGLYLAVGTENATGDALVLYKFNRASEQLAFLASANPDEGTDIDTVFAVDWSPDGQYVAVGGDLAGVTGYDLFIYKTLQFPENNVITGNTVYCNSGNSTPTGVGISGSSIANLIIGNTSFDNPFNYQFVCNEFNQLFGEGPSRTQNITVGSNVPIVTPDDLPTRIRRTNLLLESLIDNLL